MQMTAGCLRCSLASQFCLHDWLTHLLLSSTMSAPKGRLNNVVCLDLTSKVTNPKLKNVNQTGFYLPVDFAVAHLVFISSVLHASHKHEQKNSIATVARFAQTTSTSHVTRVLSESAARADAARLSYSDCSCRDNARHFAAASCKFSTVCLYTCCEDSGAAYSFHARLPSPPR